MAEPVRSHMTGADIKWREGNAPDYSEVNRQFMAERSMHHEPGSLEETVENFVKTWEMEITHKQWETVDLENFRFKVNGVHNFNAEQTVVMGSYNMIMQDTPFYDSKQGFDSSHKLFKTAFSGTFPWEVIEVISGPPRVAFRWRHWGYWTGEYEDLAPTGETIEMHGMTVCTVTDDFKIQEVITYFDPNPFLLKFLSKKSGPKGKCPFNHD